jgi:hypothetical protein
MLVAFSDASRAPIPESMRDVYQRVVENALGPMRPARIFFRSIPSHSVSPKTKPAAAPSPSGA